MQNVQSILNLGENGSPPNVYPVDNSVEWNSNLSGDLDQLRFITQRNTLHSNQSIIIPPFSFISIKLFPAVDGTLPTVLVYSTVDDYIGDGKDYEQVLTTFLKYYTKDTAHQNVITDFEWSLFEFLDSYQWNQSLLPLYVAQAEAVYPFFSQKLQEKSKLYVYHPRWEHIKQTLASIRQPPSR